MIFMLIIKNIMEDKTYQLIFYQNIMLAKISRLFSTTKVPTELLQSLRKMTQVSISDCHKALQQSQNDIDKALELLRNKGLTNSQKRIDKQTKQGVIASFITPCRRKAVLLEVNSETDFVAKSDLFLTFVDNIGQSILQSDSQVNVEGLSEQETRGRFEQFLTNAQPSNIFPQDKGIKNMDEQLKLLKSKFQQNIRIRRALTFYTEGCRYGYYIHRPYRGDIGLQGSIVQLSTDPEITEEENEEIVNEFADNIATQILGSPPKYISFDEIPAEVIERETEKAEKEMAGPLAKAPEQAKPNIVAGKLFANFYSNTLLGCMPYLLSNEGAQVSQIWEEVEKKTGANISIHRAISWEVK